MLAHVDRLDADGALCALAAFIRTRKQAAEIDRLPIEIGGSSLPELVRITSEFVIGDPEGGKRGQAVVAAALDMVFSDVVTNRVNDPSVRRSGDVIVLVDGICILSAEVKQRAATETEILQFVARLPTFQVRRGIVALLAPRQPTIDVQSLRAEAWNGYGVHLSLLGSVEAAILAGFIWCPLPLEVGLDRFAGHLTTRLIEIEVSETGIRQWLDALSADS